MHETLLRNVVDDWTATMVLPGLIGVVREVWRTNVERHEPELGDDAVTLGMGSARNFANRVVREFALRHGVQADLQNNSLRVVHLGRTLRASKLPGKSAQTDPQSIDWETSVARHRGPMANSQQLELFGLPEEELLENARGSEPRHLHLAWAGDADNGNVAVHLGFPRDNAEGGSPWYAVTTVYRDELGDQLPVLTGGAESDTDRFDQRPVPQVAVRLREDRREADGDRG